jgi:hypothetical protein
MLNVLVLGVVLLSGGAHKLEIFKILKKKKLKTATQSKN